MTWTGKTEETHGTMKLFMTSSPGGSVCVDGRWTADSFDPANGFLKEFRNACRGETDCLVLSSDPENTGMGDEMQSFFREAFLHSGMSAACGFRLSHTSTLVTDIPL